MTLSEPWRVKERHRSQNVWAARRRYESRLRLLMWENGCPLGFSVWSRVLHQHLTSLKILPASLWDWVVFEHRSAEEFAQQCIKLAHDPAAFFPHHIHCSVVEVLLCCLHRTSRSFINITAIHVSLPYWSIRYELSTFGHVSTTNCNVRSLGCNWGKHLSHCLLFIWKTPCHKNLGFIVVTINSN